MVDALRGLDWVPRSVRDKVRRIEEAQRTLEVRLGRIPEDPEIAAEAGITVAALRELYARWPSPAWRRWRTSRLADDLAAAATQGRGRPGQGGAPAGGGGAPSATR